ncbi:hypothetical protein BJX63DRAFT_86247 [Aspergillus granulosus]|uniref:Zn(2)-C6 fungal-type domain-containing protein n=1 Tax=Aspergillus granulosus TaxID=176169 RepID=A0ABR4GVN7_9EURO
MFQGGRRGIPQTDRSPGCRTCRIRKVKCDEERLRIEGQAGPHCRRCSAARILCEWQGGPIPRKKAGKKGPKSMGQEGADSRGILVPVASPSLLVPTPPRSICSPGNSLQAANSLSLSTFDRLCLDYLQSSALVIVLGKHWPWSTIYYAYERIAVNQPMLMSAILASTASEIHQSRLYDQKKPPPHTASADIEARVHYGRALSSLREALKQDVRSPEQVEAIFITLWLLIDYENRFGNGAAAINIHIRGIQGLLFNHVVPSLKYSEPLLQAAIQPGVEAEPSQPPSAGVPSVSTVCSRTTECDIYDGQLRRTAVPLFLLWTLYFYSPGVLFNTAQSLNIDNSLFRCFLLADKANGDLTLEDLYRISRQSPSRFWGEIYPATAKLDDLENLPGLKLYHRSHVTQFKITELFKRGSWGFHGKDSYSHILEEIVSISEEYDIVLSSAKAAQSCDIPGAGRRVMETIYWASITFYGTIVYFYLCTKQLIDPSKLTNQPQLSRLIPLETAVSHVLELSLRLYRSRPRLMLRIPWQLFMAGIATSDTIYQDWVSIRLRELGRYGRNFTRLSDRYDEIIHGGDPFASVRCLGMLEFE